MSKTRVKMWFLILEVCFVLICVKVCFGNDVRIRRGLNNPPFKNISESTNVIRENVSDSLIQCVVLCMHDDECRSVSYNKLDNRCRLFSQDFTGQAPTGPNEIGWTHFDLTSITRTLPHDCSDVQLQGNRQSGLYTISKGGNNVTVWCDLETEGGRWTVFQRRSDGSVDFDRDWDDYVTGFGDPSTEYWIGNEALSTLTSSGTNELLIRMETFAGNWYYAHYSNFRVNNGSDKYRLHIEGFNGTAGDGLTIYSLGRQFSTRDQDNDEFDWPCNPTYHSGGWWFSHCADSDLNGLYYSSEIIADDSCHWNPIFNQRRSLRTVFMMVRKK